MYCDDVMVLVIWLGSRYGAGRMSQNSVAPVPSTNAATTSEIQSPGPRSSFSRLWRGGRGMRRGELRVHVKAAVHREVRAGDVGGAVGGEERDRVRDFLGHRQPPGGNFRDDLLAHVLADR